MSTAPITKMRRMPLAVIPVAVVALAALAGMALLALAADNHRRAGDTLAKIAIEVANAHAARSGSDPLDATVVDARGTGARIGGWLDALEPPAVSARPVVFAGAIAARLWPLSRTIDVSAVAALYLAYAAAPSPGAAGTIEPGSRDTRFAALLQTLARNQEAAEARAATLLLATQVVAAATIAGGALALIATLWRRDRRRDARPAEAAASLPRRVLQPMVVVDSDGVVRQAEGGVEALLGVPRSALIGVNLATLAHTEDSITVGRFMAQLAKDPKNAGPITFRPKHVENTWLACEVAAGRRAGEGPRTSTPVKILDVTSRLSTDEALRKSTEVFQTLVDALPLAIVIEDSGGCVRLWNAAAERTFGWRADQVLGRANPSIPESSIEELRTVRKRVFEGESFTGLEATRVTADGTALEASITMAQLKRSDGRRGDVMEVIIDVTDRKQLESQLRQAQKMEAVGRLAGGIAHDFNNLLTAIVGHTDMLLKRPELSDPSPQESNSASVIRFGIDQIQQAGHRAAELTQQLLAFSRAQVLQPTVLNLNTAVADMEPMLRRLIGEDIDLAVVPCPDLESIKADSTQIAQVIMNLVLNARDAMPTGGRLTLETHNVELDERYVRKRVPVIPGAYVMLAVSDTGTGMDKNTQARIFEPFFTTKEKGHGTGLGLATVYGIVRQSGGYIWVYSEPGHGTSFKVYLPSAERRIGNAEAEARPTPPPLNGSETVLLVEDEEMVRALVQQVLTWYGYHVMVAHNGEAALKMAGDYAGRIDLMLTDIVMPGMSAMDLARELVAARPETKVLYMSGYTDHAVVRNNLLDKSRAFLQKPFAPDRLAHKVRELLNEPPDSGVKAENPPVARKPARALTLVS